MKKLPNGRWQIRWRDPSGRQRAVNGRTKDEAQRKYRDALAGDTAGPQRIGTTFEAYAALWHERYGKVQRSESMWDQDLGILRNHLVPAFGRKAITELTPLDLVDLQARMKALGTYRLSTINRIVSLAKSMLEPAVDWGMLSVNPWRRVRLLRITERPMKFWLPETRDRFLNTARRLDPEYARAVTFACHTGLRLGEIAALTRAQIDFERRQVQVCRNFSIATGKVVEHTKSGRIRFVPLNDEAYAAVLTQRMTGQADRVFPSLNPYSASARLRRFAEMAQVEVIRFHDLRHTFASNHAMAGTPLFTIQRLLGHSDPKQTQKYAHLHQDAMKGVNDVLVSARSVHSQAGERKDLKVSAS